MKKNNCLIVSMLFWAWKRKLVFVMRLTFSICLLSVLQSFAISTFSQNSKLSINQENISVESVIQLIEDETDYYFMYSGLVIDVKRTVNLKVNNKSVSEILDEVFKNTDVTYKINGRLIALNKDKEGYPMLFQKQSISVFGKVTDSSGTPLPGVTVVVKGTTNGTVTNADGEYSLVNVTEDATLQFSFVGMKTQEIPVAGKTSINVIMEEEAIGIEEVVAVGYGTQKKANLTGAITQLSTKELEDRPVTNMTQALQGTIPNLNIVIGSGQPGTSGTLNIRGNTSITSSGEPLVLIDGIPGEIDRVNVRDVESVTVLKDASASAIYGARAAFGVILVTTKKAATGSPVISYTNNFGWTTHATNTDYITTAYDNIRINEEAYYNALGSYWTGYSEEDYEEIYARRNDKKENPDRPWVMIKPDSKGNDVYKYYANFDWFNWFYSKWRPKQEHNITIMGSSEKVRYYLSGGVKNETGIMKQNPDSYKKYNFTGKIEAELFPWLTVSSNSRFFNSNYKYYGREGGMFPTVDNGTGGSQEYMCTPANVPTNPDGSGAYLMDKGIYPIAIGTHLAQMNKNMFGKNAVNDYTLTFEGIVKLSDDISITGNYTYNLENSQDMYRGVRLTYSLYPGVIEYVPRAEYNTDILKETVQDNKYNIFNIFGAFKKTFEQHNISITTGYNREERIFKSVYAEGQDLLSETLNDLTLATGEKQVSGGASEWALSGFFYRANYDYKGKYLFEASGRYDGTSRFKKGDRFGFFPSFSAGWRISEENFFKPFRTIIDNLKIRASYGTLGNQQVDTYAYISSMSANYMSYVIDGEQLQSVSSPDPVSDNLTWEQTTSKNLGVDLNLLQNKMSMIFDVYIRDTKGMLVEGMTLPSVFGASEPDENAGDMRTKGFEISLNWRDKFNFLNKPFSYNIGIVLSDYTAKITKFDNPTRVLSDYYVGQKLGEIWGFSYDGFFKTTEEAQAYSVDQDLINQRRIQAATAELRMLQAGDIKIVDLDGDNEITFGAGTVDDPGDKKIIGNSQPRYSFGIPIGGSWNGFDISILFQGIGRQNYYPDNETQRFWNAYARPYGTFIPTNFEKKIWRSDNPDSYFPRLIGYIANNSELNYANNMYLQDLAYVKLRNLTIGYRIPQNISKKIKLDNIRIYVSGENLFTWTKLKTDYIDPEEVMWDKTSRTYPMGRTYSFGLEIRL